MNLEELTERFIMLGEAKAAYAKAHGGTTPQEAYQKDSTVKEQADAIFSGLTYLFRMYIQTNDEFVRLQYTNSSHMGWEDIESIALYGDAKDTGRFGGLMGAILTANPDRLPNEIIAYCKLRMHGEVMDAFRKRLGRNPASHGKVGHAKPLSTFSKGYEDEQSLYAADTHAVAADNALLDAEYLRSLLQALDTIKEPYKTPVQKLLQSSIASGGIDIDGLLEEGGKHDLSKHAQGKDKTLRLGLLLLKCAYLNLDDDQLPDVIVNAKRNVQEKKADWGEYSDAAFAYAKMLGFTLDDMANLVDLTASRIAQLHTQHNISHELLNLLGLTDQKRDVLAPKPLTKVKSVPLAYVNTVEASVISGLKPGAIAVHAAHMDPEQDYTPDGKIPDANYKGETVKGKALVGKVFGSDRWILHIGMVQGWAEAEKKVKELTDSGWQRLTKAAEELELHEPLLSRRASAIDPKRKYLPDGTVPDAENKGNTVLGSEVVWRHPYDLQYVLLSPRYITAHKEAEKKVKELTDSGWQRLTKAAEQIGLSNSALSDRAHAINPKRKYLLDGTIPDKEHEKNAVPGNDIVWHYPYADKMVLLRPEYVSAQLAAERKIIELKEKGWRTLKDTEESIGIKRTTLQSRVDKILPDKCYLSNGAPLNKKENPQVGLQAADLVYRHPYSSRLILLSPAYIEALRQNREERIEKPTHDVKKGGKLELLGPARTVPAEVANQLCTDKEKKRVI
jgi:hypothetical protein